jgi:hypothetical protein
VAGIRGVALLIGLLGSLAAPAASGATAYTANNNSLDGQVTKPPRFPEISGLTGAVHHVARK